MKPPKNQHQLALWYLYNYDEFDLKFVINDSMFFKFQTRLSEIENKYITFLANRKPKEFTNRFGRKCTYYIYSAIDKKQILEIYNDY